jgi:hypothetical protein
MLRVRALEVDEILACGIPNCDVLQALGLSINDIFQSWFEVCREIATTSKKRAMFSRTLLMNGRVRAIERVQVEISPDKIEEYFDEWAERNLGEPTHREDNPSPVNEELDKATHFAYLAEEICRNRSFFVTKRGFIGLGSLTVAPSTSVVFIHGLKTPFLVQRGTGKDSFRGECYIQGMMEQGQDLSDDDIYLNLA